MAQPHILVIDDLQSHLYLAKAVFEPYGYRVTVANGYSEGIRILEKGGIDLILCDIGMPGRNGFDLLEEVQAHAEWRKVPFVVITASYWEEDVRQRALKGGAAGFVFRPMEPRVLLTEVETFLPEDMRLAKKKGSA